MDILTKQQRSYCMSRIRSKNTAPEKRIRKFLTNYGLKYRLNVSKLPGKPDVVISRIKKVIFINGCFWHQHKNCKKQSMPKSNQQYWIKKLNRNVQKQKEDIKKLKKLGWSPYLIWECQTKNERFINQRLRKILL
jgi:DNA mismatch endonuclease (patch repair protein)